MIIEHEFEPENESGEVNGKHSKMVKLEIPAEKPTKYEYSYETEGPIHLSQLNVT